MKYYRRANPLPMVFRLAGIHSLYVIPAWFILYDFSRAALPNLLSVLFSAIMLLIIALIRLRGFINNRTQKVIENAFRTVENSQADTRLVSLNQRFGLKEYLQLNLEVMFSYLRPYVSLLAGIAFLVVGIISIDQADNPIKVVLAFFLCGYFLVLPWLLFFWRLYHVYRKNRPLLSEQIIHIGDESVVVQAGDLPSVEIRLLSDIAVTRNYLLLFTAGTNYIQLQRAVISPEDEALIIRRAVQMISE